MRQALLVCALVVLSSLPAAAQDPSTAEKNFTLHLDFLQPTAYLGPVAEKEARTGFLVLGVHVSTCRIGRIRACSLGVGWGTKNSDPEWLNTLLVTSPVGFRINDASDGVPEIDFNVTPMYDASLQKWGVAFLFSIGG